MSSLTAATAQCPHSLTAHSLTSSRVVHRGAQDGADTTARTTLLPAELLLADPLPTVAAQAAAKALQAPAQLRLSTGLVLPPEPPRVRIFPHVEGNFATVIYITGTAPPNLSVIDRCHCACSTYGCRLNGTGLDRL